MALEEQLGNHQLLWQVTNVRGWFCNGVGFYVCYLHRCADSCALDSPELERSGLNSFNVLDYGLSSSKASSSHNTDMSLGAQPSRPLVQGVRLLSIRELPDRCRAIFPYKNFNAVQSKCFEAIYREDNNFVLSAPTGSGKTAIFELAICRLMSSFTSGEYKVVYQAPTKSLCSERLKDWQTKFAPLGLTCTEATGDTEQRQLNQVRDANIIITTPEKWDSMTRKWKDHAKLMQLVKLFLIDEVHMLKDERGATLEAVVSRMKSIGTNVRFVALSATVPNADDIATWLGKNSACPGLPAFREHFGEEFRPVILQKHICAYPSHGSNTFVFENTLNSKYGERHFIWSYQAHFLLD
jgi:ATP-dependent DNA helicase HFM1/MER3